MWEGVCETIQTLLIVILLWVNYSLAKGTATLATEMTKIVNEGLELIREMEEEKKDD